MVVVRVFVSVFEEVDFLIVVIWCIFVEQGKFGGVGVVVFVFGIKVVIDGFENNGGIEEYDSEEL